MDDWLLQLATDLAWDLESNRACSCANCGERMTEKKFITTTKKILEALIKVQQTEMRKWNAGENED